MEENGMCTNSMGISFLFGLHKNDISYNLMEYNVIWLNIT
jgi:hypothetical protein